MLGSTVFDFTACVMQPRQVSKLYKSVETVVFIQLWYWWWVLHDFL